MNIQDVANVEKLFDMTDRVQQLVDVIIDIMPIKSTPRIINDEMQCVEMIIVHDGDLKDKSTSYEIDGDGYVYITCQIIEYYRSQIGEYYHVGDIRETRIQLFHIKQINHRHIEDFIYGWLLAVDDVLESYNGMEWYLPWDLRPGKNVLNLKTPKTMEDYHARFLTKGRLGRYLAKK